MSHCLLMFEKMRPESKCPTKVMMFLSEREWWSQQTSETFLTLRMFYFLLVVTVSFPVKIQTFKLFSFLICLPLYINQICKYCTFESYVWIVLYRLRLATKKKKKTRKKKRKKVNSNSKNLKNPKEPCCTVSAFISRPACEWMCHSVIKQYTLQYLHKKEMPSKLGRGCRL